jgi:glycosyltransferase involved in cell wall biosynthesis
MRIGIEAERANVAAPTGVEHYAKQLIINIARIDLENQYVLYLRSAPQEWIKKLPANFSYKIIPFPVFWTQLRISWEMITDRPDALFIMASALPLIHPKNSVVTIHDLGYVFYPETFTRFQRNYLRFADRYISRFARKIIAVSEQTKKDLLTVYKTDPSKVEVVHHGFDMSTENMFGSDDERRRVAALPEKFILHLSTLQPRKNVIALIDAFIELKKEKNLPHSLVLAGGKGWLYDQIMEKIAHHPEVIYFGYIDDRFEILRKAQLLVHPAFYEGFGMGLLDAFAARVPVACSNTSSLPEVAGPAAVYFDPKSKEEMKQAIYEALTNEELRRELVAKGGERLKEFTWQKCAEKTLRILKGG